MTPAGESFEGVGLAPDQAVKVTPEDLERADPVLDAALDWIREED